MDGCSIELVRGKDDNTNMDAQRIINELERMHSTLNRSEEKAALASVDPEKGYPYALGVLGAGTQMVGWDIEALIDTIKESESL